MFTQQLFSGLRANVNLHNSLLDSVSAAGEKRERFVPGAFESGTAALLYSSRYELY